MQNLKNKHILLGVTGSIAAYKSADLTRKLRDAGALVRVVMTESAKAFITPLTMQAVSGNPVHDDLFSLEAEAAMGHIELARWADLVLIAPASADLIARLAQGRGNDLLTAVCLAAKAPLFIAPAMNQNMWHDKATQENIQVLKQRQINIIGPDDGMQACGDIGVGRMNEPTHIISKVNEMFATGALAGLKVVITAGPTREAIDPVRYLTNASSGKMGYALAEAAREAGAEVILISGPVNLPAPQKITVVPAISATEMHQQVLIHAKECDIFIGVAAVADYRCEQPAIHKLAKSAETMQLNLIRNPDVITAVAELTAKPFVVGFAAETTNIIENARQKRLRKKMDLIVANQVGDDVGFDSDDNTVTVIGENLEMELPLMSKSKLARELVEVIASCYQQFVIPAKAGIHPSSSTKISIQQ